MSSGHLKIIISSCFSLWKHFFGLFQKKRPKNLIFTNMISEGFPIMKFFYAHARSPILPTGSPHCHPRKLLLMRTNLRKTAENS